MFFFCSQEFFARKAKRKGRWRVPVARVRIGIALVRLTLARRKQRKLEKLHADAIEAYRVRFTTYFWGAGLLRSKE